jgi:hypothetical protein
VFVVEDDVAPDGLQSDAPDLLDLPEQAIKEDREEPVEIKKHQAGDLKAGMVECWNIGIVE